MKKYLILLAAALIMALTACEGPMGPPGPVGPQGPPGNGSSGEGVNWKIEEYEILEKDWKLVGGRDALGSHYMCEFPNVNWLTNTVFSKGKLVGYRILTLDNGSKVYTPLPYIIARGQKEGSNEKLWSEYYTFDFQPGSIAFYAHYTDFYTGNRPPTCYFRIVATW